MARQADIPAAVTGGSFLTEERAPGEVLTPEDLGDEQRMLAATATDFMQNEVLPRLPEILALDYAAIRDTLGKAGALGLLGIEVPVAYGGLGLGNVTSCVACQPLARDGSFVLSFLAHTGMGTLPIVHFGTEAQKRKYLPRLVSGEWISSFSLSEASSGSDALDVRATAVLSSDGRYWVLNGEKMWLTNAGVADVYLTFAKVNGERFSAFIVEKSMPGVSLGPEARKSGLKGSSTRPLVLTDAQVPRENLLGDVGNGVVIALGSLNVGRFKLAAANAAAVRFVLEAAVKYGSSRAAFGRVITDFGLVRHKIAEMAILAYVADSIVYRTGGMIDRSLERVERDSPLALKRIDEYAIECSLAKVWCSEALGYAVDENVQIFGGSGYVEDFPAERWWRDARANRIFEGTNEINRLLISGRLVRNALRGDLPLHRAVGRSAAKVLPPAVRAGSTGRILASEERMLAGAKSVAVMCLEVSLQKFGEALADEQEVLGHLADVVLETFALESALLRARKRALFRGEKASSLQLAAVRCFAQDVLDRIEVSARHLLAAVEQGERLWSLLAALRRRTKRKALDTVALRRDIADAAVRAGGYPLS